MPRRSLPPPITISLAEARAIALRSQGLADDPAPFGLGKDAVLRAIQHLGYVQIDSISVLQRAHHHVLWSRVPDYTPDMLHSLQDPAGNGVTEEDAAVFEYWNHAASYLPIRDYQYSLPLMRKYRKTLHWAKPCPELDSAMRRMKRRINQNGPLKISEVEVTKDSVKVDQWFSSTPNPGKIERRALHELWMRGEIMIRSRHGFEKVFDLPERVLPAGILAEAKTSKVTASKTAEFHVRRGLKALGIARLPELHYLQDAGRATDVRTALNRLLKEGTAVELRLAEHPDIATYALHEALNLVGSIPKDQETQRARFLSPFDNLTIQRKRLKWLFDFDYTVEIYVPPAKRKYGYFVLPILWGDRIIGRMDAKADRASQRLLIHNLVFEPRVTKQEWKAIQPAFRQALDCFTQFQACTEWKIARTEPTQFKAL